jgi:4-hydroxy-tetrahydrodipicolinate synthase
MRAIGRHVSKLLGYAPALPTPFNDQGNIDDAAFARLCELQIANGATALVVCETTGEAPTLSPKEHRDLVRIAVSLSSGRVPVIAGAGANATAHAVELTRDAEAAGADAILSVVPYYNKPTQAGLYAHFREIAGSTGSPVILYDAPSRTACSLADETVARLAEVPNVMGLNDASGDATGRRVCARSSGEISGCFVEMTRLLWLILRRAVTAASRSRQILPQPCVMPCLWHGSTTKQPEHGV